MSQSHFYNVTVTHRRLNPCRHDLRYSAFFLLLDLDETESLTKKLRLFSADRWNLLSFYQADHGSGVDAAPGALRRWVERTLACAGPAVIGGRIRILSMPRVLGHAFNPITVYFCDDASGQLAAVIYEVNNTFRQRHFYVVPVRPDAGAVMHHSCDKQFYVSPFMPMEMVYAFTLLCPGDKMALKIDGTDRQDGTALIEAAMTGISRPLTDRTLLAAALALPWLGLKIIAGIHWEAVKLWRKGLRFYPRPKLPTTPVTMGS